MKRSLILPLLALCTTLATSRADLVIVQELKQEGGQGMSMAITTKVKDRKIRIEPNPRITSIIDLDNGELTSVINSQKMYFKIPASALKKISDSQKAAKPDAGPAVAPKATGKTETINGFVCDQYEATINGSKIEIWTTKGEPEAKAALEELAAVAGDADPTRAGLKKQDIPGFPIRSTATLPDGSRMVSTVVSIKKDTLPASEFTVPANYQEMPAPLPQ